MSVPQRRRQRGLSLIEVLVAFSIFTLVMGVVVVGALAGAGAEGRAQENILASQCARQVVENVRLVKGAKVASGTYTDATNLGPIPQLARLNASHASVDVSTYSGDSLQLVITLDWRSRVSRATRTTTFTAVVAPDGASL